MAAALTRLGVWRRVFDNLQGFARARPCSLLRPDIRGMASIRLPWISQTEGGRPPKRSQTTASLPSLWTCQLRLKADRSANQHARRRGLRGASASAAAPAEAAPAAAGEAAVTATHFSSLTIKDFALITEQCIRLQPGLTVITGESGAGKSVLVEALGQVLGAAASDESVRPPANTAVVEAQVSVAPAEQQLLRRLLGELGVPQRASRELGSLTLRRELIKGPDGSVRSRCFINGSPTSVRVLREVGQLLVDVNGQHAALTLKDGATRLRLLDKLAGTTAAADGFAASLAEWQLAQAQLRELDALSDEQQREAMQRLVDEVLTAGVEEGEERALRQALRQLDGRRAAAERCRLVSVGLSGSDGGGIADALRDVQLQVKQLLSLEDRLAAQAAAEREGEEEAQRGPSQVAGAAASTASALSIADEEEEEQGEDDSPAGMLQAAVALLEQAQAVMDEAEEQVVQYAKRYRFSQAEYDEMSARLQQLERLMKQHDAASTDQLLDLAQRQEAALDLYFQLEGQRDSLEGEAARLLGFVQQQAVQLSQQRQVAAGQLQAAVEAVLGDLAMAGSRFDVRLSWTPLSTAAGGGSSGAAGGTCIGVSTGQAASCGQEGGQYRVRPSGLDLAEFLYAAGPGEPLRPLSAVASGGESARLMLALKAAPAFMLGGSSSGSAGSGAVQHDGGSSGGTSTSDDGFGSGGSGSQIMLLDEIDSGIGSRLGQPIGRILRRMAGPAGVRAGQILCVSHLPQVAAHAEHHLCVRKATAEDDRVCTQFEQLQARPERLREISAMLGLPEGAAEDLLQAAQQEGLSSWHSQT